ncbi:hypothetical protein DY000_02064119 [Brassica cretica]|uniref:Uncharacterized protein n=1 Tax=Brassica cretica TaxID=69181 RepID=A0ABQ7AWK3_BRACR|nr:hypothetical protein DY000_02064119 [Brassica cretica]
MRDTEFIVALNKIGTPICVPSREFIDIGRIASIENNHKPVDYAKKGHKDEQIHLPCFNRRALTEDFERECFINLNPSKVAGKEVEF